MNELMNFDLFPQKTILDSKQPTFSTCQKYILYHGKFCNHLRNKMTPMTSIQKPLENRCIINNHVIKNRLNFENFGTRNSNIGTENFEKMGTFLIQF